MTRHTAIPLRSFAVARAAATLSLLGLSLAGLLGLSACGSADAADYAYGPGGTGLSPGGAQDFGRFKAVLDAGKLPGPETLDQVGFFAEHTLGSPPTSCRDAVCVDGLFGAMANMISGSTCTLMQLQLGTPLDPMSQPRPPIDAAIIVDHSSAELASDEGFFNLRSGINKLLDGMDDNDTVTLISQDQEVRVLADKIPGRLRSDVRNVLPQLWARGVASRIELYDGLRQAVDSLGPAVSGRHRRLIFVGSAQQTGSIRRERSLRLLRTFAEGTGGVTVLALGEVGQLSLLQGMADAGAGALYYAQHSNELPGLFEREVSYSLIPVAEKVSIRLTPGSAYRLREVFGISESSWQLAAEGGEIRIPALFAAWRKYATSVNDRRGGGGGILVEVLPRVGAANERPATVSDISVEYNVPGGPRVSSSLRISAPDGPFGTPDSGRFSKPSVEKGFVVLNLYVGLRMASQRSAVGDLRGAYDVLEPLERKASEWNDRVGDLEVFDDLRYVRRFLDLLRQADASSQPPRAIDYLDPWPHD